MRGVAFILVLLGAGDVAAAQTTTLITRGVDGSSADESPTLCDAVSADGRYVLFSSYATNLVAGDTNGATDVFLHDRLTRVTTRVSVNSRGEQGNGGSSGTALSADHRFVAFYSAANNLVSGDTNGFTDVFVHDVLTGETSRVDVSSSGEEANDSPGLYGGGLGLSSDGRFVCFSTRATNLSSEPTGRVDKAFVHDRASGETRLISSCSALGRCDVDIALPTSISADGRWIAFDVSFAGYTTSYVALYDRFTDATQRIPPSGDALTNAGSLSADGRFVAFRSGSENIVPGDTNGTVDLFVFDRVTESVSLASLSPDGRQGAGYFSGRISEDGRTLTFATNAPEFTGVRDSQYVLFVRNLESGTTIRRGAVEYGGVSSNGACTVAYLTSRSLAPDDTNGFGLDLYTDDFSTLDGVEPSSGSEAGGDVVTLRGSCFSSAARPVVRFGDREASVLSTASDRIRVVTPAGLGVVDVSVAGAWGDDSLHDVFTYVPAGLAARFGNVNTGRGDRENVLLVDALSGDPATRELSLHVGQPITIVMLSPSSRSVSRYVLYAWSGLPSDATLATLPRGVGSIVFPPPFATGSPQPLAVWNVLGHPRVLGAATLGSRPAPSLLASRRRGSPRSVDVTLQGLIEDDASPSAVSVSVTNAMVLRIR
jgi:Tol biopolymer transport system component